MEQTEVIQPCWRKRMPPTPPQCPVCGAPYADGTAIYQGRDGQVVGCGACVTSQYA